MDDGPAQPARWVINTMPAIYTIILNLIYFKMREMCNNLTCISVNMTSRVKSIIGRLAVIENFIWNVKKNLLQIYFRNNYKKWLSL